MKANIYLSLALFLTLAITSCKKDRLLARRLRLELRVQLEPLELLAPLELQVRQDQLEQQVLQEQRAPQELPEAPVQPAR